MIYVHDFSWRLAFPRGNKRRDILTELGGKNQKILGCLKVKVFLYNKKALELA